MRLNVENEKLRAVIEEAVSKKRTREVLEKLGIDVSEMAQKLGIDTAEEDAKLEERVKERLGDVQNFRIVARRNNFAYAIWESNFKDRAGHEERRIVIGTLAAKSGAPLRVVSLPVDVVSEIAQELAGRVK